ncbi:hypothetical protein CL630_02020 [bacterium]|nr:hypothetical protein [bacterium]|tara:strand:- start:1815 stop:2021 length:207 start_codon:yes stop_codon:yes gene_type:complete
MAKLTLENKKMSKLAHRSVVAALREILSDPDAGLVLRTNMFSRIKKSVKSKKSGNTTDLKIFLEKHRL